MRQTRMSQIADLDSRKGPLFVMGCQRSGTSALWRALCQHPNLRQKGPEDDGRPESTMKELWFLREFFLGRETNRSRPHAETLIDEEFKIGFARLVDQFCIEKYAGPTGRWISAHPADGLYLNQILELYPEARVLYLTRHPQEVAWSSAYSPWVPKMTREEFLKYAASSTRWWRRFGEICVAIQDGKFGDHVMLVRHERMISRAEEVARDVLEHVGENFDENVATSLRKVLNSSFLKDNAKSQLISQVRKQISRDIEFCKVIVSEVGNLMELLDYRDLSGESKSVKNDWGGNARKATSPLANILDDLYVYFERHPVQALWLHRLLRLIRNNLA